MVGCTRVEYTNISNIYIPEKARWVCMIPAMPISKTHSTLFTFQHSTSSLKLSGSPCPNLNKLTEANRTVPRSPQTSDVWLTCGRTDQLSSWDYLTHTPQATTPKNASQPPRKGPRQIPERKIAKEQLKHALRPRSRTLILTPTKG